MAQQNHPLKKKQLAFPILIRPLNGVDQINNQAVVGHRHIVAAGLLHNGTVDGVDLCGDTAFHVLIHGGVAFAGVLADVMHHVQHLHVGEVGTICLGHIHSFADHLFGKVPCVLVFNHVGDGCFGDGCEGVDGQIYEQLAPDDALNVVRNGRLEASFGQQVSHRLQVGVFFQIAADGSHAVSTVANLAAAEVHRVVLAGTDDDVLGLDVLCNFAVVARAVLQGHYEGILAEKVFVFFQ